MKINAVNNCPYRDFGEPPTFKVKFRNSLELEDVVSAMMLAASMLDPNSRNHVIHRDEDAAKLLETFAVKFAENGGL